MAKVQSRVIGGGLAKRERAFDVNFKGPNDPAILEVASLPFIGMVTIAIYAGNNACAFITSVGRQNGELVLGQPLTGANCLPALQDDGTVLYVTFQYDGEGAYELEFSLDGKTVQVTQIRGPVPETVTFYLS